MSVPATPPSALTIRHIAGSLLLLLLACLVSAAAAAWSLQQQQRAQQALQKAQAQQNETRSRLARVHDDEREIRARISRYQDIVARGLLQPEQRLQWVEILKASKDARHLLGLDYEIAPQRPFGTPSVTGGHQFLVSSMKLEMPLLHEEDLLGLLDDLTGQSRALINVNRCRINRLPADTQRATLQASCDIDWINLQEQPG